MNPHYENTTFDSVTTGSTTGAKEITVDLGYIETMNMLFSCHFNDQSASQSGLIPETAEDGSKAWVCHLDCGGRTCRSTFLAKGRACLKVAIQYS